MTFATPAARKGLTVSVDAQPTCTPRATRPPRAARLHPHGQRRQVCDPAGGDSVRLALVGKYASLTVSNPYGNGAALKRTGSSTAFTRQRGAHGRRQLRPRSFHRQVHRGRMKGKIAATARTAFHHLRAHPREDVTVRGCCKTHAPYAINCRSAVKLRAPEVHFHSMVRHIVLVQMLSQYGVSHSMEMDFRHPTVKGRCAGMNSLMPFCAKTIWWTLSSAQGNARACI
jgi:hypothetical protein